MSGLTPAKTAASFIICLSQPRPGFENRSPVWDFAKDGIRMSKGLQIALGATIVVALLGWYAYTNVEGNAAFQYYRDLDEFMANADALENKALRVHGYVANDSINRDLDAKKVVFAVQGTPPHSGIAPEQTLEVLYLGLETPDMFRDGAEVVIEGRIEYQQNRTLFLADNLMAKCPSKFEAAAEAEAMASGNTKVGL